MKTVDLCLKNAKILRRIPIEVGIAIDDGKITSISKPPSLPKAERKIDLQGFLVLPGIVDPHVHFRDPGFPEKEDFYTGSRAAAAGGVTTVVDMPNTRPPTDSLKRFVEKRKIGEKKSLVDFGLHSMVIESRKEREKLVEAGSISFKLYPELTDDYIVKSITETDGTISVHPEDPRLLKETSEGKDDLERFIRSRPRKAEFSEVRRILNFSKNVHVHFCHVTSENSLKILEERKEKNKFTSEVTPHHLFLDKADLEKFGPIAKVHPPLRSRKDREYLLEGLNKGQIEMVATDHAPHSQEEKKRGMKDSPPGIVGVETSLPLMFTLVKRGKLKMSRFVEVMCLSPAKIFGLRNENGIPKGSLKVGADADLVAIDHRKKWKIKGRNLHGKTKFTPFENREVIGKPYLTLVRGKTVFRDGELIERDGHGKFLPKKTQSNRATDRKNRQRDS